MNEEELKNKCTERAKIFQQAMESCHSSSPIDCIEWFADRIAELEKENAELKETVIKMNNVITETFSKLTKAKEIINDCVCELQNILFYKMRNKERIASTLDKAEQFLNEVEK